MVWQPSVSPVVRGFLLLLNLLRSILFERELLSISSYINLEKSARLASWLFVVFGVFMDCIREKLSKVHYGWVIVICGGAVIFASFGLARYAYTMLLPAMQVELGLAYSQTGMIGTSNFTGYLAAVLVAPLLIRRYLPRKVITVGLLIISISIFSIGFCQSYIGIIALYTIAGFGGGLCNIPMMMLITNWFCPALRGRAIGIVVCGNGTGIMFTGVLIPLMNRCCGASGWRYSWEVIGLVILLAAFASGLFLRNHPSELNLKAVGYCSEFSMINHRSQPRKGDGLLLVKLGLLFGAFGLTFMVYGTFIVETMVAEYGLLESKAGLYWSWVGVISFFSGVFFGTLSDRVGRKYGFSIIFIVQTAAYLLVGLRLGQVGLIFSLALYGLAVFAIPTVMTAAIGDFFGPSRAASSLAVVTIFFATGQALGPGGAGYIAEVIGSVMPVYLWAAALTAAAALYAFWLPPVSQAE
jgi:MFS family permease